MLNELFKTGTKDIGISLILIGILPSALLVLFIASLIWSGAPNVQPDLNLLVDKVNRLNGVEIALLVVSVITASLIFQPLQLALVRILEGYWQGSLFGNTLSKVGVALHRRQRNKLENARIVKNSSRRQRNRFISLIRRNSQPEPAPIRAENGSKSTTEQTERANRAAWLLQRYYPVEDHLQPTTLGNILRASEDAVADKYGLNAVVVWPRLYPLLSDKLVNILTDQRNQLDIAVRFCAVFLLAALVSALLLYQYGWWMLVPLICLLLAWASYRAAISAALVYGDTVQTAFDLHRFDLLTALHLQLPLDRDSEKSENEKLSTFLLEGGEWKFQYVHPPPRSKERQKQQAGESDSGVTP